MHNLALNIYILLVIGLRPSSCKAHLTRPDREMRGDGHGALRAEATLPGGLDYVNAIERRAPG